MVKSAVFLLQALYTVCIFGLALYGIHAMWLTWHYVRRNRDNKVPPKPAEWPSVTVQLPIYNERHVAERLIRACAHLDYPSDKLQIQILDDSDDLTAVLTDQAAEHWRSLGHDVVVIRRNTRAGYKAGALKHALQYASGDFVAIFDADFVPPSDFLASTLPYFLDSGNERVGFVQARWGHLNAEYSSLTRCQALALDGHFVVEQTGREQAGFPFGFNGSGGVWRRACIEDDSVGGWDATTLCEDLDLSYRAQLAGWSALYRPEIEAPAEIPPQLLAFKRQQFRWAKGSVQTLRKLGSRVWHGDWPLPTRLAALFHLGNYLIHPLLLLMLLAALPLTLLDVNPASALGYLSLTSIGPPLLYALAQRHLHPTDWARRWFYLPVLVLIGTGLCFNNSVAVYQGLLGKSSAFLRTPKFHVQSRGDPWRSSTYRLPLDVVFYGEIVLAIYALLTAGVTLLKGNWVAVPFMLIYAGGFLFMVSVGLWQARHAKLTPRGAAGSRSSETLPYARDQLRIQP